MITLGMYQFAEAQLKDVENQLRQSRVNRNLFFKLETIEKDLKESTMKIISGLNVTLTKQGELRSLLTDLVEDLATFVNE